MINYLQNNQINREKWDDCVQSAINGVVYAQSWYLDIVCENWEALVEDDYVSIFPLPVRQKWGIHYVYQPAFTQQLGIISRKQITEEIVNLFLDSIPRKIRFAEINLNTLNKASHKAFKINHWQNYVLDLISTHNQLYKNYSDNLRRNLKKAEKSGLSIIKNIKPEDVIKLFRENRGRNISGLGDTEFLKLSRISYQGIYKGQIMTYGILTSRNDLCAGAIILKGSGRIIFLFSGLSEDGRNLGAMPMMIDSIIKEQSQQHLIFDFEGSNDPNLARFYHSFGSTGCTYPHLRMNRLTFIIRAAVTLIKWLKKCCNLRYP